MLISKLSNIHPSTRFRLLEIGFIVLMASVPLFFNFPYRINIFLSWEGAYRIYLGQIPFKDFSLPMGYAYWMIPALFFKIFGPYLITLIKAQVFINIISALAFSSILRSFRVEHGVRLLSVVIFCLSYSFFNFWPWYNHSVIVFQLISFSLLFKYLLPRESKQPNILFLVGAAVMGFIALFTKQDAGGLGLLIIGILLLIDGYLQKKIKPTLVFGASFLLTTLAFILPLLKHDFFYWFNFGQEPHNSRLALIDFLVLIMGRSDWIKFYLFLIIVLFIHDLRVSFSLSNRRLILFYLFTVGILVECLIFQVTSYTPPDNNIFFHSFAFAFIFSRLPFNINFSKTSVLLPAIILVFFWWSGTYWKYTKRILDRAFPELLMKDHDKVSITNYASNTDTANSDTTGMAKWVFTDLKVFEGVYMPEQTVAGLNRLISNPFFEKNKTPKVLNMTELTPLAEVLNYDLESGTPLWYHVGVSIFDKDIAMFSNRIRKEYYDVVLFQEIPNLNNFYPKSIHKKLKLHYHELDVFLAPRRKANSSIYVYVKEPSKWQ